jgi:hypothetical protein
LACQGRASTSPKPAAVGSYCNAVRADANAVSTPYTPCSSMRACAIDHAAQDAPACPQRSCPLESLGIALTTHLKPLLVEPIPKAAA